MMPLVITLLATIHVFVMKAMKEMGTCVQVKKTIISTDLKTAKHKIPLHDILYIFFYPLPLLVAPLILHVNDYAMCTNVTLFATIKHVFVMITIKKMGMHTQVKKPLTSTDRKTAKPTIRSSL